MTHAYKGAATVFRADRRWAAFGASGLRIEVPLNIFQESIASPEIFTIPITYRAPSSWEYTKRSEIRLEQLAAVSYLTLIAGSYSAGLKNNIETSSLHRQIYSDFLLFDEGAQTLLTAADDALLSLRSETASLISTDFKTISAISSTYLVSGNERIEISFLLSSDYMLSIYHGADLILFFYPYFVVPGSENLFSLYLSIKPNIFHAIENQPSANFLFSFFACQSLKSSPFSTLTLQTNYLQKSLSTYTTKLLFQKEAVSSRLINLIEEFLVRCSISSEFTSITEFTTEILNLLTSSIPVWKPLTPYGGVFFTNLTRIYKPLIDLG